MLTGLHLLFCSFAHLVLSAADHVQYAGPTTYRSRSLDRREATAMVLLTRTSEVSAASSPQRAKSPLVRPQQSSASSQAQRDSSSIEHSTPHLSAGLNTAKRPRPSPNRSEARTPSPSVSRSRSPTRISMTETKSSLSNHSRTSSGTSSLLTSSPREASMKSQTSWGSQTLSNSRTYISSISSDTGRSRSPSRYPSSGQTEHAPSDGRGFTTSGSLSSWGSSRHGELAAFAAAEVNGPALIRERKQNSGSRRIEKFARSQNDHQMNSSSPRLPDHTRNNADPRKTQTVVKTLSRKARGEVSAYGWRSKVTVDARKSELGGFISAHDMHAACRIPVKPGKKKTKIMLSESGSLEAKGVVYGKGIAKVTCTAYEPGFLSGPESSHAGSGASQ